MNTNSEKYAVGDKNPEDNTSLLNNNYLTFFEQAPVSLWVEDFSKAKAYIEKIAKENNTDIKSFIFENPKFIKKLINLIEIKDINDATLKLYKASSKKELLQNLSLVFSKKSFKGFSKLLSDIILGETVTEIETINKTLQGEEFNALVKYKVSAGSEITLENVIVSIENITTGVTARKAVIESEFRYKEAQSLAKIGSWFHNFETDESHWSDEAYKILGLVAGRDFLNFAYFISCVHPEDREFTQNFSTESFLKNPIQNLQYRIITSTGELKYIYEIRRAVIKKQQIIKVIGIGQDITEQVLNEQKLTSTKSFLSNTLASINDGLVILDRDAKYTYVNQKAADLLGKKVEELIGKQIWTEFSEKKGDLFYDKYQKAVKKGKPLSFENYFEPWNKWFENRIIPSQEGVLMFFHETTEKKETESKIKAAYNIINKSSSVAFLCENKYDFPIVFTSENSHHLFGYTHQEILNDNVKLYQLIYLEDREWVSKEFLKFLKNEKSKELKFQPFRVITKNGEIKWIRTNLDIVRNSANETTHIQGISEDITAQKKTEKENKKLLLAIEKSANIITIANLEGIIEFINPKFTEVYGFTKEEVVGKKYNILKSENQPIEFYQKMWQSIIEGNIWKGQIQNKAKNGELIWVQHTITPIKNDFGTVENYITISEDITEHKKAENLFFESNQRLKDQFNHTPLASIIWDANFKVLEWNNSAQRIFGYTATEAKGLGVTDLITPKNFAPEMKKILEEILTVKNAHRSTNLNVTKSGKIITCDWYNVTLKDASGKIIGIASLADDITDRIKKEALENVLYNISKAALTTSDFKDFSLFIRNELHKIIDTSNFYIALYNEETDMINTPVFMDELEDVEDFSAKNSLTGYVIKSKKPLIVNQEAHQVLINSNKVELVGEHAKIWIGVPLIIQDKCIGAIVVQSYVDENAYNENDVHLLEFVADQISTTIQRKKVENELNVALQQAKESDRLKSAFLANMSHEIRTPMNGIIGFSELSLDPNITKEKQIEFSNIVIKSSKRLLSIVNDILDISKIEAGAVNLNLENVNLNKLLDELAEFYKPIAQEKNILLTCEKGLENFKSCVESDKVKLNQVFTNLLSNAFKFTDTGSVSFGYQLIENNLQFYVKDTGIGVDDNLHHRIFDRFSQGNLDLSKQHKGTGLGLAITKKIVELFQGEIWLNSSDQGTTIYFKIPYIKSKTPLISSVIEEQKPSIQVKNNEITILVAEDEEYNMMYITELFASTNFKILEAKNGKIALELAQSNPEIQLVLLDIKMPIMDGNEAMKEIKKIRPALPVIALSAFAMESDKTRAMGLGFDDYLTKPLDRKLLFQIIEKFSKKE